MDPPTLECPEVDIDKVAAQLKLHERARSNGKEDIPLSSATQLDGPQRDIVSWAKGKILTITSSYEKRLKALSRQIQSRDVQAKIDEIDQLGSELRSELRNLKEDLGPRIRRARNALDDYKSEYEAFKERFHVDREPNYPKKKIGQVAIALIACVAEGFVNSIFYYQGLASGIAGGVLLAFVLAVVDVSIVFFLGRGAVWVVSKRRLFKGIGALASLVFLAWAMSYNLLTSHIREYLQNDIVIAEATELAWVQFSAAPFGLQQADSWVLFSFGVFFSVLALYSGLKWDDAIPFYGSKHRKLVSLREDYEYLIRRYRRQIRAKCNSKKKRLDELVEKAKTDLAMLNHDFATMDTLRKVATQCVHRYLDSCETLLRIYRDENLKARSTPPPQYFDEQVELDHSLPEPYDPQENIDYISEQEDMLRTVTERTREIRGRLNEICDQVISELVILPDDTNVTQAHAVTE